MFEETPLVYLSFGILSLQECHNRGCHQILHASCCLLDAYGRLLELYKIQMTETLVMLNPAMALQQSSALDNSLSGLNFEATVVQVMELAQGGSLLDYVRQRKRLAEPEACFFLQQIVHGLMHCHDMEVCLAWPLK